MPHFDIVRKSQPKETYRVASVIGTYDLQTETAEEHFVGDIELPEHWNVGLIVGRSGTGKTTIANELFGAHIVRGYEWTHECLLDDFPQGLSMNEIYQALNCVGFSSPPSWLKPFSVLSNGEKMRCELARAIVENHEMFVFDEFTSVVDREIAKIGSLAAQKAIRRSNKQFIAVTCHHDVQEWLMPDWVFNTDSMTFQVLDLEAQKKNRPKLNLEFFEVKGTADKLKYWNIFRKYHYLDHNFNKAAHLIVCTVNGNLCGFAGTLHFPHPKRNDIWKGHRTVVLPDYQGVGIGGALSTFVAEYFVKKGYTYRRVTSNPAMIASHKRSKKWKMVRFGRVAGGGNASGLIHGKMAAHKTISRARITATFEYCGRPSEP